MRILSITAGTVLGYALSVAASLGWFHFTHGDSFTTPTHANFAVTAVWCVLEGVAVGSVAAAVGGSRNSSFGVAILIVLVTVWAWLKGDLQQPLWSLDLVLIVLAPATALGFLIPLPGTRKVQA